ncbi:uncharacterized protein LOC113146846 [Cyclospora cayetanensis]|uniref:Uncharacterized protein LOC113146846 n=1 Tax=Cyclospora cayetanensis TaxID=88456 RepID=A0A6P6RTQ4_9EIME|nr:uncharacterized protein LOC113146846 [Cyclospora cayetanensis]
MEGPFKSASHAPFSSLVEQRSEAGAAAAQGTQRMPHIFSLLDAAFLQVGASLQQQQREVQQQQSPNEEKEQKKRMQQPGAQNGSLPAITDARLCEATDGETPTGCLFTTATFSAASAAAQQRAFLPAAHAVLLMEPSGSLKASVAFAALRYCFHKLQQEGGAAATGDEACKANGEAASAAGKALVVAAANSNLNSLRDRVCSAWILLMRSLTSVALRPQRNSNSGSSRSCFSQACILTQFVFHKTTPAAPKMTPFILLEVVKDALLAASTHAAAVEAAEAAAAAANAPETLESAPMKPVEVAAAAKAAYAVASVLHQLEAPDIAGGILENSSNGLQATPTWNMICSCLAVLGVCNKQRQQIGRRLLAAAVLPCISFVASSSSPRNKRQDLPPACVVRDFFFFCCLEAIGSAANTFEEVFASCPFLRIDSDLPPVAAARRAAAATAQLYRHLVTWIAEIGGRQLTLLAAVLQLPSAAAEYALKELHCCCESCADAETASTSVAVAESQTGDATAANRAEKDHHLEALFSSSCLNFGLRMQMPSSADIFVAATPVRDGAAAAAAQHPVAAVVLLEALDFFPDNISEDNDAPDNLPESDKPCFFSSCLTLLCGNFLMGELPQHVRQQLLLQLLQQCSAQRVFTPKAIAALQQQLQQLSQKQAVQHMQQNNIYYLLQEEEDLQELQFQQLQQTLLMRNDSGASAADAASSTLALLEKMNVFELLCDAARYPLIKEEHRDRNFLQQLHRQQQLQQPILQQQLMPAARRKLCRSYSGSSTNSNTDEKAHLSIRLWHARGSCTYTVKGSAAAVARSSKAASEALLRLAPPRLSWLQKRLAAASGSSCKSTSSWLLDPLSSLPAASSALIECLPAPACTCSLAVCSPAAVAEQELIQRRFGLQQPHALLQQRWFRVSIHRKAVEHAAAQLLERHGHLSPSSCAAAVAAVAAFVAAASAAKASAEASESAASVGGSDPRSAACGAIIDRAAEPSAEQLKKGWRLGSTDVFLSSCAAAQLLDVQQLLQQEGEGEWAAGAAAEAAAAAAAADRKEQVRAALRSSVLCVAALSKLQKRSCRRRSRAAAAAATAATASAREIVDAEASSEASYNTEQTAAERQLQKSEAAEGHCMPQQRLVGKLLKSREVPLFAVCALEGVKSSETEQQRQTDQVQRKAASDEEPASGESATLVAKEAASNGIEALIPHACLGAYYAQSLEA